ncbi:21007_t:CDS:2 [Gigaspora rosea]|nr:21007_t:CDS:2 [Gigaspora rosea]
MPEGTNTDFFGPIDDNNNYLPNMYDVLLTDVTDVNSKDLHEEISELLKAKYLSYSPASEFKEVHGIIYGRYNRIFVSLPVKVKRKVKNVHFLVDTSSPSTYICEEVYESFKATIRNTSSILINNKPTLVFLTPVNFHFTGVNVFGMDYLNIYRTKLIIDLENHYVSLSFGSFEQNDYQSYPLQYISGSPSVYRIGW